MLYHFFAVLCVNLPNTKIISIFGSKNNLPGDTAILRYPDLPGKAVSNDRAADAALSFHRVI
jgi:hypothetical protein